MKRWTALEDDDGASSVLTSGGYGDQSTVGSRIESEDEEDNRRPSLIIYRDHRSDQGSSDQGQSTVGTIESDEEGNRRPSLTIYRDQQNEDSNSSRDLVIDEDAVGSEVEVSDPEESEAEDEEASDEADNDPEGSEREDVANEAGSEAEGSDAEAADFVVKRKRKKYDEDDQLEEDDYELLEENLGVKLKRRKFRRIKDVDSDDEQPDDVARENIANELFNSDEDLPDIPEHPITNIQEIQPPRPEYNSDESGSSDDGFIVEDELSVGRRRRGLGDCSDAGLAAARDIFGMEFNYDEIQQEGEESDVEDVEGPTNTATPLHKKKYYEIYEPAILERAGLTESQIIIRNSDVPERHLKRGIVEQGSGKEMSAELEEELREEAVWLVDNLFLDRCPGFLADATEVLKKEELKKVEEQRKEVERLEGEERDALLQFEKEAAVDEFGSIVGDCGPIAPASSAFATTFANRDHDWEEEEQPRPVLDLPPISRDLALVKPEPPDSVVFKRPEVSLRPTTEERKPVVEDEEEDWGATATTSASSIVRIPDSSVAAGEDEEDWGNESNAVTTTTTTCATKPTPKKSNVVNVEELPDDLKKEYHTQRNKFQDKLFQFCKFLRFDLLEVPHIYTYQKDSMTGFTTEELWKIYAYDWKFRYYYKRKQSLQEQVRQMEMFLVSRDNRLDRVQNLLDTLKFEYELEALFTYFKYEFKNELVEMRGKLRELQVEITGDEDKTESNLKTSLHQVGRARHLARIESSGVGVMLEKFGCTVEEFGRGIKQRFRDFRVGTPAKVPFYTAVELVTSENPSGSDILQSVKLLLADKLFRDPAVLPAVRKVFEESIYVTVRPTKKGMSVIDEGHPLYSMKFLSRKPATTFTGDEFLRLNVAESDKLVTIQMEDLMVGKDGMSYIQELKEVMNGDDLGLTAKSWNYARGDVIDILFQDHLLPLLRKQFRAKLVRECEEYVIECCAKELKRRVEAGPFTLEEPITSVIVITYSDYGQPALVAGLDGKGNLKGDTKLLHFTKRADSVQQDQRYQKEGDLIILKGFLTRWAPQLVVIAGQNRDALRFKREVQSLLEGEGDVQVELVEAQVGRIYSESEGAKEEFPSIEPKLREAVSIGRLILDPLCEYARLFNVEDDILHLKLHPLQDYAPKESLLQAYEIVFMDIANRVGADLNDLGQNPHRSGILQFICGLGRVKANHIMKLIKRNRLKLENRSQFITRLHFGPHTFINSAGFLKIDVKALGEETEVYIETLDQTRIHPEHYEWTRKIADSAVPEGYDDQLHVSAVETVMENPSMLVDLDLEMFAAELEKGGYGYPILYLGDICTELGQPFADTRGKYMSPSAEELFMMLTKEGKDFGRGKIVTARVTGIRRTRPSKSDLENALPEKSDVKKCPICFKADFMALEELWHHLDTEACPGAATSISIVLDNGVWGSIPMDRLSSTKVQDPFTRVSVGQTIVCRIEALDMERFSAECTSRSVDLADEGLKPPRDEYYDQAAEDEVLTKLNSKPDAVYMKRLIVHPNFKNISFEDAEKALEGMEDGDCIVRPSSKGLSHLSVSWRVAPSIIQHIPVLEQDKPTPYTIGRRLLIQDASYDDLDEIIARYVGPMATIAASITSYQYYRQLDKEAGAEYLQKEKEKNPSKIHYLLSPCLDCPGRFMIGYLLKTVMWEYFTVTPNGIRFRGRIFEGLDKMLAWFKRNYGRREAGHLSASHYRAPPVKVEPSTVFAPATPLPRDAGEIILEGAARRFPTTAAVPLLSVKIPPLPNTVPANFIAPRPKPPPPEARSQFGGSTFGGISVRTADQTPYLFEDEEW